MISKITALSSKWKAYKENLRATRPGLYQVVDIVEVVTVALSMALLIRYFIVMVSVVPSPSMEPTLMVKDRLFVNRLVYRVVSPHRGDIVVFKSPFGDGKDFVKRCVALPGENIRVVDGEIYINGKLLVFPGVNIQGDHSNFGPVQVPDGYYFMMGDNRANSYDSRFWYLSNVSPFISRNDIIGQAWVTFWPVTRMRVLK